jgi:hypothetical protein
MYVRTYVAKLVRFTLLQTKGQKETAARVCRNFALFKFANMALAKIFGYFFRPKHAMHVTYQCVRTYL